MTAGTIRRLLVVDPVRHDRRGHHWHFAEGVLREARRHGFAARFFVARSAAGRAMPAPDMHPVIRHGLYRPVTGARDESIETDYELGSAAMRDDLMACAAFDPGPGDLILVPSASLRSVGALAAWRAATGNPAPVAFFFHFLLPMGLSLVQNRLGRAVAARAGESLRRTQSLGPYLLSAANETFAHELGDAMGCPFRITALPLWYDLGRPYDSDLSVRRDAAPIVAFVGELREEKGGPLLPDIASALAAIGTRARLHVQAGVAEGRLLAPLRIAAKNGLLTILDDVLSESDYVAYIQSAAAVLLPYERSQYRTRTSGAFAFAAAHGRPSIVPDGTWMAENISSGRAAGVLYAGNSPAAIARAIDRTIASLAPLQEQARDASRYWQHENSGPRFVEQLLEWTASTDT